MVGKVVYFPKDGAEKDLYSQLLTVVNPAGEAALNPGAVANLFQQSGLDRAHLKVIWELSRGPDEGLPVEEFYTMLRGVTLVQNGKDFSEAGLKASADFGGLPRFKDVVLQQASRAPAVQPPMVPVTPPSGQVAPPHSESPGLSRGSSASSILQGGSRSPWTILPKHRSQYVTKFIEQKPIDGMLGGKAVMFFFMKSGIPKESLRQIWDLADTDKDGSLTEDEFCIALHLIMCVTKRELSVPQKLPAELAITPAARMKLAAEENPVDQTSAAATVAITAAAATTAASLTPRSVSAGQSTPIAVNGIGRDQMPSTPISEFSGPTASSLPGTPGTAAPSGLASQANLMANPPAVPSGAVVPPAVGAASLQALENANLSTSAATASIAQTTASMSAQNKVVQDKLVDLALERETLAAALNSASSALVQEEESLQTAQTELEALRAEVNHMQTEVFRQREESIEQKEKLSALRVERKEVESQLALLRTEQEQRALQVQEMATSLVAEQEALQAAKESAAILAQSKLDSSLAPQRAAPTLAPAPARAAPSRAAPDIATPPQVPSVSEASTPPPMRAAPSFDHAPIPSRAAPAAATATSKSRPAAPMQPPVPKALGSTDSQGGQKSPDTATEAFQDAFGAEADSSANPFAAEDLAAPAASATSSTNGTAAFSDEAFDANFDFAAQHQEKPNA